MMYKLLFFTLLVLIFSSIISCRHRGGAINKEERSNNREQASFPETSREDSSKSRTKSVVKMRKESGVYHVPCKINGTEMEFIFDTGASNITMSLTEASFLLKQGKLTEEDFIGTQQYQIADGSIHEGAVVVLRKVVIGNWELTNVKASIVDNMNAPLLLGQSALAAFGKISIDYNREEITFE